MRLFKAHCCEADIQKAEPEKLDRGIKNPGTLFTGIRVLFFFITDRGLAQGVYFFPFLFLVSNCFALVTGAD